MLHKDGARGRRARWRLRLAESNYIVESRPGQHHHAADVMSRLATSGAGDRPIPEEIPALLTLANFSRGWVQPCFKSKKSYPPLSVQRILQAQATDARCKEQRDQMNQNANSRIRETLNGLLVRLAPLHRAVQIVVPKSL